MQQGIRGLLAIREDGGLAENPSEIDRFLDPVCQISIPLAHTKGSQRWKFERVVKNPQIQVVMADEEDGLPDALKGYPAYAAAEEIFRIDFGAKLLAVRINGPNSRCHHLCLQDVENVMTFADRVQMIVIPDVRTPADFELVEKAVVVGAEKYRWSFLPRFQLLIEHPLGVENLGSLLRNRMGIHSVVFGPVDYCKATGYPLPEDEQDEVLRAARLRIMNAANAYGVSPIDGPSVRLFEGCGTPNWREELKRVVGTSRQMRFRGTWIIHESQAAVVAEVYGMSAESVQRGFDKVNFFIVNGGGAMRDPHENTMMDEATVLPWCELLVRASAMGHPGAPRERLREIARRSMDRLGMNLLEPFGIRAK